MWMRLAVDACTRAELIWTSKIASALTSIPVSALMTLTSFSLLWRQMVMNCCWNALSSANFTTLRSLSSCSGPHAHHLVVEFGQFRVAGQQPATGVTPLVTLHIFSGHSSDTRGRVFLHQLGWISATPFTLEEPMTHRLPMRTLRTSPSSMMESLALMASLPGHLGSTSSFRKRALISK